MLQKSWPAEGATRVPEMGGSAIGSGDSRVTGTAVRGLWQAWRRHMGV
jgi:hypothetical protein